MLHHRIDFLQPAKKMLDFSPVTLQIFANAEEDMAS
jgi:hypothetical protein